VKALLAFGTDDWCSSDGNFAYVTGWFVRVLLTIGRSLTPDVLRRVWVVDGAFPFRLGVVLADERTSRLAVALPLAAFAFTLQCGAELVAAKRLLAPVASSSRLAGRITRLAGGFTRLAGFLARLTRLSRLCGRLTTRHCRAGVRLDVSTE